MKVMVLGAGGLLGTELSKRPNVIPFTHLSCDVTQNKVLHDTILGVRPDVIINCAGITPKAQDNAGVKTLFSVNSIAPIFIATIADMIGARLIHISTDCVFNGSVGGYYEDVKPFPRSLYGMSKLFGEITYGPHLTIRTSFVGLSDPPGRGLLAWAQKQTVINGWSEYRWNGLTTRELSNLLFDKIIPDNVTGLLHVTGQQTVTKYDLLEEAKQVFAWDYVLIKDDSIKKDRTLLTFNPEYSSDKTLHTMLMELKDD